MNKFAVQILYFDCDQFILKTISNCAPFVDKIFITYSPEPWIAYNNKARELYRNPSNPNILKESDYYHKLQLIEGIWQTEEDQRNDGLRIAKQQGYDYLIIQDADEFYLPDQFKRNLEEINASPGYSYYRNPWYIFWKNRGYIIENRYFYFFGNDRYVKPYRKTLIGFSACFAINLKKDVLFEDRRLPNRKDNHMLTGLCFHLSFVISDEQLIRKLNTWGHSNQGRY